MAVNEDENHTPVRSKDGTQLKLVDDFKYLGSFVADSKKDFLTRKAPGVPATSFITSGNQISLLLPSWLSSEPV